MDKFDATDYFLEAGETKRANKAKKKAAGFTGDTVRKLERKPRDIEDPNDPKFLTQLDRELAVAKQSMHSNPKNRDMLLDPRGKPKQDPAYQTAFQYYGTDASGKQKDSPVPTNVQYQASKMSGGKVVFGRYYDGKGNYLGRTQGGQWVDAASDPNAQAQMEIVSKLEELQARLHEYNKDSLKEAIRKIYTECGYK